MNRLCCLFFFVAWFALAFWGFPLSGLATLPHSEGFPLLSSHFDQGLGMVLSTPSSSIFLFLVPATSSWCLFLLHDVLPPCPSELSFPSHCPPLVCLALLLISIPLQLHLLCSSFSVVLILLSICFTFSSTFHMIRSAHSTLQKVVLKITSEHFTIWLAVAH